MAKGNYFHSVLQKNKSMTIIEQNINRWSTESKVLSGWGWGYFDSIAYFFLNWHKHGRLMHRLEVMHITSAQFCLLELSHMAAKINPYQPHSKSFLACSHLCIKCSFIVSPTDKLLLNM